MTAIGRVPRGLLDFFRIQSQGSNPQALSETIAPTLDMVDFYAATESGDVSICNVNVGLATGGTLIPLGATSYGRDINSGVVPQNEVWLLLAGTLGIPPVAVGTVVGHLVATPPNYAGMAPWFLTSSLHPAQQGVSGSSVMVHPRIWLPPQWQLNVWITVNSSTAPAITSEVMLRVQRFHI